MRATYQVTVVPRVETEVDLPYKSPYREGTVLTISTDRPDALVLTPSDGEIYFGPHEERQLGITVRPCPANGRGFTALIFINDDRGRSIDCLAVQVSCSTLPTPHPGGSRKLKGKKRAGRSTQNSPVPSPTSSPKTAPGGPTLGTLMHIRVDE